MGRQTGIAWTHHTFNPWIGCEKVSPACTHCYAEWFVKNRMGKEAWGKRPRILTVDPWREIRKWNKAAAIAGERRRVFCASLADIAEDFDGPIVDWSGHELWWDVDRLCRKEHVTLQSARPATLDDLRGQLWPIIRACEWLDFLFLTKRPENLRRMVPTELQGARHIWFGTTVESSEYLWRAEALCEVPAVVRFLSIEPQLEEIDVSRFLHAEFRGRNLRGINWLITGGESKQGKGHSPRPYDLAWPRSLLRQGRAAGVPVFVKQLGSLPIVNRNHPECNQRIDWDTASEAEREEFAEGLGEYLENIDAVPLRHPKGEDPSEWPADLQVQEFPIITAIR